MTSRFLLLVALLFFSIPQGRSQIDLNDPLGSVFRISAQSKLRQQLPPKTCTILFSGGLSSYDPQGIYPRPFLCDPDFFYYAGYRIPDAVLVVFAEARDLAEGSVKSLLFMPDKSDIGLAYMGYEYRGKFGLMDGGMAIRPASQWRKFCLEILAVDGVERIFTKPAQISDFQKPSEDDYRDNCLSMYAAMAPGFPFDRLTQTYFKRILGADFGNMAALAQEIRARMGYAPKEHGHPILERFVNLRNADELRQLQEEIRRIKIDLSQFSDKFNLFSSVKSDAEIERIRKGVGILENGFAAAATRANEGGAENKVLAEAQAVILRAGGTFPMPLVVASGKHSAQPNYVSSAAALPKSGPMVVDLAIDLDGFVARATRTFPIGGTFPTELKPVYEGVLAIHQKFLKSCQAKASIATICSAANQGFEELDRKYIFSANALGAKYVLKVNYLWNTGHGLNEQVLAKDLQAGNVICVETALYLGDQEGVTAKWRGNGIVLRDMVFIGPAGPEVLTKGIPSDLQSLQNQVLSTNRPSED